MHEDGELGVETTSGADEVMHKVKSRGGVAACSKSLNDCETIFAFSELTSTCNEQFSCGKRWHECK